MLADVIGVDAALNLVEQLPRRYRPQNPSGEAILYVPKSLALNHRLVAILGYPDAMKLVRAYGGEILYPTPICKQVASVDRDDAVDRMTAQGKSRTEIATMFQLSERQVKRIIDRHGDTSPEESTPSFAHSSAHTFTRAAA